jgi:hypothetical protein
MGVSNYAKMFDKLCEAYPRGEKGKKDWAIVVNRIKAKGKGKKYDCIIGVSGGTDSSYLLHLAKKEYQLRPLAVNLDNGWSSDIAVKNIKKITKALDIDLETYVIDYEEVKKVLRAYIKAGLPWVDGPTDNAIDSVLFKIAKREGINFILNGSDFRSEGKQPSEWTYTDAKQMLYIVKKYEQIALKTYPYQKLYKLFYLSFIRGIKVYRPYYYIDYNKNEAQQFLIKNYDWEYYGGHHHENIFTKFAIAYWMPKKFNIDKRIITLSAQILSDEITKAMALNAIKEPPYDVEQMERDKEFVMKKLDFSKEEFSRLWDQDLKYYKDYPSYMPILNNYFKLSKSILRFVFPFVPSIFAEKQNRQPVK